MKNSESRYPTNSPTCLYIRGSTASLMEIIEKAHDHFGADVDFADLEIGREHFHARCIGYDLYDSGDYDDYITIEKV